MKKFVCPFCGRESEHEHCDHCFAMIPMQKEDKPKDESVKTRKKDKEMN